MGRTSNTGARTEAERPDRRLNIMFSRLIHIIARIRTKWLILSGQEKVRKVSLYDS